MAGKICISIDQEIIHVMLLRGGPTTDLSAWIENILWNYLGDTEDNEGWQEEYYEFLDRRRGESDFRDKYGDTNKGYRWQEIDLPNGTQLYMEYKKQKHYASVQFEKIMYEGESYSPAILARKIANGTTRNAWRDFYIKRPGDNEWKLADVLRRQLKK